MSGSARPAGEVLERSAQGASVAPEGVAESSARPLSRGKRVLRGALWALTALYCLVVASIVFAPVHVDDNEMGGRLAALLDAGHSCQNVYLACEDLKLGCCAIAAYDQKCLDELLGLPFGPSDAKDAEFAVYACAVGRPK